MYVFTLLQEKPQPLIIYGRSVLFSKWVALYMLIWEHSQLNTRIYFGVYEIKMYIQFLFDNEKLTLGRAYFVFLIHNHL